MTRTHLRLVHSADVKVSDKNMNMTKKTEILLVELHHTMKPDTETHEGNSPIIIKEFDGNIRIYYRTFQQLASGKHNHHTRNPMSIINSPTMANIKIF
jgi:hypothetical protein